MGGLIPRCEIFVSLAFVLLLGCSTTATAPVVSSLKLDESFTHEAIVAGKMGIGGVVSLAAASDRREAATYARLLRSALMNERADFVVLPVEEVTRKIGIDSQQMILEEYAQTARLSLPSLKEAQAVADECRYIVFARVIDNEVEEACREYTETDPEEGSSEESIWVELITTRHITASMDVYDLVKASSVFHGTIDISKSAIKKYSKTKDRNIGEMFLRIPVHAFVQTALQPKPPSTEKLLGTVFVAFAKNMP